MANSKSQKSALDRLPLGDSKRFSISPTRQQNETHILEKKHQNDGQFIRNYTRLFENRELKDCDRDQTESKLSTQHYSRKLGEEHFGRHRIESDKEQYKGKLSAQHYARPKKEHDVEERKEQNEVKLHGSKRSTQHYRQEQNSEHCVQHIHHQQERKRSSVNELHNRMGFRFNEMGPNFNENGPHLNENGPHLKEADQGRRAKDGKKLVTSLYVTSLVNKGLKDEVCGARPPNRTWNYGVDRFMTSFHIVLAPSRNLRNTQPQSPIDWSNLYSDPPSKMVIAIDKVYETVAVVPRPSYQQQYVYSQLEFSDHRRHKEQVNFCTVLHPVKYSDTAYVYINNTRKRFVSRTFYELRMRPKSFSDTTFNNPKTEELHYVTHLDYHADENRKWFKTCVEIKAKKFTSTQLLRSQNNNYINTSSSTLLSSSDLSSSYFPNGSLSENDDSFNNGSQSTTSQTGKSFKEIYDPGASQVFIPQRKDRPLNHHSLINGELILSFSRDKADVNFNTDDFSDV